MSDTCPRCGAPLKARFDTSAVTLWQCGSEEVHGVFRQGEDCTLVKLLNEALNPTPDQERQRRVQEITEKLLKHAAELLELADELDGVGCTCGRVAGASSYVHGRSCPVWIAWGARQMARPTYRAPRPLSSTKDVRHLTPPFRK